MKCSERTKTFESTIFKPMSCSTSSFPSASKLRWWCYHGLAGFMLESQKFSSLQWIVPFYIFWTFLLITCATSTSNLSKLHRMLEPQLSRYICRLGTPRTCRLATQELQREAPVKCRLHPLVDRYKNCLRHSNHTVHCKAHSTNVTFCSQCCLASHY